MKTEGCLWNYLTNYESVLYIRRGWLNAIESILQAFVNDGNGYGLNRDQASFSCKAAAHIPLRLRHTRVTIVHMHLTFS